MSPLYALLLATPIFGFQLSAPALDMAPLTEVEATPPPQAGPPDSAGMVAPVAAETTPLRTAFVVTVTCAA